jgi:hypothetical protein
MDETKLKTLAKSMADTFIKHHNVVNEHLIQKIRVNFLMWLAISQKEDTVENLLSQWRTDWKTIRGVSL